VRTEVKNQVTVFGNAVVSEVSLNQDQHRTWLWLGPSSKGSNFAAFSNREGLTRRNGHALRTTLVWSSEKHSLSMKPSGN
jgi:hypothetical protein